MRIPNNFLPSKFQKQIGYDEEGRLIEFNLSRQHTGGIGNANSMYATHAEQFDVMTPFLKANKAKDAPRRNYIIQPGGAAIYFGPRRAEAFPDPYGGGRVQYTVPDERTFFGHNTAEVVSPNTVPHNQGFVVNK